MKKQSPQKMMLQLAKDQLKYPLSTNFVKKYMEICRAMDKPMNGLERAKIHKVFRNPDTENILEMLELIDQWEKQQQGFKIEDYAQASPNPQVVGPSLMVGDAVGITQPNGTTGGLHQNGYWVSDNTGKVDWNSGD